MKRIMKIQLALSFVWVILSGITFGQVPQLINYQGVLINPATGQPVPDNAYSITFSIYDVASGGSAIWTETQSVTTKTGVHNVLLGSSTALTTTILSGPEKYLGIKVGSDPEMTPRKRIVSVAYAILSEEANKLDGKHASAFADSVHNHDNRYYTETELNTSDGNPPNQGSNRMSWDNLKDVPEGFADGVDNVGTANSGGWVDDGSTVRLETSVDKVGIGTSSPHPDAKLHIQGGNLYMQGGGYNFVPQAGGNADIAFYRAGTESNSMATLRRYGNDHTIFQILTPPTTSFTAYEATLALVRGDEPNVELVDFYNNGYPAETQFGIRMQKRGTGQYRDFVFDYSDGTTLTEVMRLTPAGNIGIGTSIPGEKLEISSGNVKIVSGELSIIGEDKGIKLYNTGPLIKVGEVLPHEDNFFDIKATVPDNNLGLRFFTTPSASAPIERMRILGNGNVGIGTINPGNALSVAGIIESKNGGFKFPDGTIQATAGSGGSTIWNTTGNNIYYSAGNVGIGTTTPGTKLEVLGDLSLPYGKLYFAGPENPGYLMQYLLSDGLKFKVNNQESLFLSADGNAGIGTSSPTAKLDVNGRLSVMGTVGIEVTGPPSFTLHVNGTAGKPGGGSWLAASDRRLKDIKKNFTRGLDAIDDLNPVYYQYKQDNSLNLPSEQEYIGLVAQEVEKVIPEAVERDKGGYQFLNNDPVIWTMLNAIKELKERSSKLLTKNEELKAENAAVKTSLEQVKAELDELKLRMAKFEFAK